MARIVLQYTGCIAEIRDELYCKRLAGKKKLYRNTMDCIVTEAGQCCIAIQPL